MLYLYTPAVASTFSVLPMIAARLDVPKPSRIWRMPALQEMMKEA